MSRALLLAALAASTACSEAALEIRLGTLPGDSPYDGLREIVLVARADGRVLERQSRPFDGGPVELDPIARQPNMNVTVEGLDESGAGASKGQGEPQMPERGGACCIIMCFCSVARFDAEECTCGSNECDSCYR